MSITRIVKLDVLVALVSLIGLFAGALIGSWLVICMFLLVGNGYAAARVAIFLRGRRTDDEAGCEAGQDADQQAPRRNNRRKKGENARELVDAMIEQGRYALILRPELIANATLEQRERAAQILDDAMALTPEGAVMLKGWRAAAQPSMGSSDQCLVRVEAFFLDRYPVTNRQFSGFVTDGGYEQISLWSEMAVASLLDFTDQTGHQGPAFWRKGVPPPGKDDHPVVGVSWHEAVAFARWAGKRLPGDAEWVKAAAWPVGEKSRPLQRKFPWGDAMEPERANLWASKIGETTAVDRFGEGVSVGGAYQLAGNVWEWTADDFACWGEAAATLETMQAMKCLRGGAFDTYFDRQAASDFYSGDTLLARKRNIGFRCALSLSDLAALDPSAASSGGAAARADSEALELMEAAI